MKLCVPYYVNLARFLVHRELSLPRGTRKSRFALLMDAVSASNQSRFCLPRKIYVTLFPRNSGLPRFIHKRRLVEPELRYYDSSS